MHEREIWELAGKINAGEGTEADKKELEHILLSHPEIAMDIETIAGFWNYTEHKSESEIRHHAYEKLMLRIQKDQHTGSEIKKNKSRIQLLKYIRYAAAVIILLSSAALVYYVIKPGDDKKTSKTIIALNGTKSHLTLPDGSKVWLNAGSTLKYDPISGSDSIREVFLCGEAYFEVAHREDLPFIIHTSQMDIKDIGTSFNVRAYPGEGFSETTLIEGSVEIIYKNKERTLLTEPNQKITVFDSGGKIQRKTEKNISHQLLPETAWMKDVLIFKNETFQQLALRMERYYDIDIEFENDILKNRRITGTFSNETFEQALISLQLIIKFHYRIEGRRVSVFQ
ncbi:MAG TPA: FecR domain-containing protein [Flavitalea sp.]|nr:FecR domain-containing protein [Flavitalea sp.]